MLEGDILNLSFRPSEYVRYVPRRKGAVTTISMELPLSAGLYFQVNELVRDILSLLDGLTLSELSQRASLGVGLESCGFSRARM
jgi:hypothetical protein